MTKLETKRKADGFTLVEMLVVITIIALLASAFLPAVKLALRRAGRATTKNTISGLDTAITMFRRDWGTYPPHSYGVSDPTINFPDTTVAIPRNDAFKFCDSATDKTYKGRVLMFFLSSRFELNGKTYGPYFSPKEKQMDRADTTMLNAFGGTGDITKLKITLWNGDDWKHTTALMDQDANGKLVLLDGFDNPYFYYSNVWAKKQDTSAVIVPHRPFEYVIFSTGQDGKSAWNDHKDNDNDGVPAPGGDDDLDPDERLRVNSSGRYLDACGKQVGQLHDDINNW